MLLHNLYPAGGADMVDIDVRGDKIHDISKDPKADNEEDVLSFEHAIVFPGLINSHDHLDFNLFPQSANKKYASYVEWGNDIHLKNKEIINAVLKIPLKLRVKWGIYKNLLNGITTVVNHGEVLNPGNELITVFEKCNVIHSVQFQKNWKLKLNFPAKKYPFVIHTGEGTDEASTKEIDRLIRGNVLKRDMIGIHGVAMTGQQAKSFKGLVWCPASNFFMLGKTAPIDQLKKVTNVVFGTDSTLSAIWNLWEHLRIARDTQFARDEELFDMMTTKPASLWGMSNCGKLKTGYDADLVVARKSGGSGYDSFYRLNPKDILMVMSKGRIRLVASEIYDQLDNSQMERDQFSKVFINGIVKYVYGDLPGLINEIKGYYPDVFMPVETNGI